MELLLLLLLTVAPLSAHRPIRLPFIFQTKKPDVHPAAAGMKPEVIEDKVIEDEMVISGIRESCNNINTLSPCSCSEVQKSEVRSGRDGKDVVLAYTDFVCNNALNDRKMKNGRIPTGFTCMQLSSRRTLYRSVMLIISWIEDFT